MARKTLAPWGNHKGHSMPIAKVKKGKQGKPSPDSSLSGMSYPANKPALWPIEDGLRASPTVPGEAYATKYNEILNKAYTRAGYAG